MNEVVIFLSGVIVGIVTMYVGIKTGVGLYYQIKEDMPEKQRPIEQEYTDSEES